MSVPWGRYTILNFQGYKQACCLFQRETVFCLWRLFTIQPSWKRLAKQRQSPSVKYTKWKRCMEICLAMLFYTQSFCLLLWWAWDLFRFLYIFLSFILGSVKLFRNSLNFSNLAFKLNWERIRTALNILLVLVHYWGKILLSPPWIYTFSSMAGTDISPRTSGNFRYHSLKSFSVLTQPLMHVLVIYNHACTDQYSARDLRDSLCRSLQSSLCVALSSVLCPENN